MLELMSSWCAPRAYFSSLLGVCCFASLLLSGSNATAQEACFERIDNGVDKTGWHVSTTNHHGPGDGWTVEDGAFVGRQTAEQKGGILMTEKVYKDVEVVFEVKVDWGCDSGFFFRTTDGDRAYQVNVDHLAESGVGTIYGEGFSQELRAIPYFLTDMGNAAVAAPGQTPSFDLAKWPTIWHPTEFNEMRARVEGNPPRMQVWISDFQVMDFTDTMLRNEIAAQGPLAIQVHSGGRWIEGGTVRFRNIRVKDLTLPCDEPEPGTGGNGGAGGAAAAGGATAGSSAGGVAGQGSAGASGQASGGVAGAMGGSPSLTPSSGSGASPALTPTAADEAGGCACAIPAISGSVGWELALAFGALMLRRARRRALS
jgi:hypothetical protein